jgi:hypothetical protein
MSLLPTPTIFWVESDANASPGLYVSSTSVHFPETRHKESFDGRRQPDPWKYYYPRMMTNETLSFYWTAILPRRQVFDGFLTPLNNIELEEIVINETSTWRLDRSLLAEWKKIEATLYRASCVLNSMVLMDLDVNVASEVIPWPSVYEYSRVFPSRKTAMSAMRSVRAVFMLKVAKLSYLDLVDSKLSSTWLDVAEEKRLLSLSDTNSIRLSSICTKLVVTPNTERVGMIIDVRSPLNPRWQIELEKLITAFHLPVWMYFGTQPSSDPGLCHCWYSKYIPSAVIIKHVQESMPAIQGVRTYVLTTAPQTTSHGDARSVTQTCNIATHNVSALPSRNTTGPRPDPSTRQILGETHKEFFKRQHAVIQAAYNTGTTRQLALWNARKEKYKDLECPDNTYRPTVFRWEEDEDEREVRILVGQKHWQAAFRASARTQRKYNEVLNEFDICIFLDPQAIVVEDDEYIYITPYNVEHDSTMSIDVPNANVASMLSTEQSNTDTTEHQQARGRQPPLGHQVPHHSQELGRREQDSRSTVEQSQVPAGKQSSLTHVHSPSPLAPQHYIHPLVSHTASVQDCPAYPRHGPSPGRSHSHSRHRSSSSWSCSRSLSSCSHYRSLCQDTCSVATLHADSPLVDLQPTTLETAIWIRYGILTSNINHEIPTELKKRYEWLCKPGKVQTVLGHYAENVQPEKLEAIRVYLAYIGFEGHKNSLRAAMPMSMADTINPSHSGSPYNLKRHIAIIPGKVEGEMWYKLIPLSKPLRDVEYTIILKDALAVNQMLREGTARSTYDLAVYFISRGIAFKTAQCYNGTRHMMWPSPPMPMFTTQIALGLGTRESNQGKLTLDDYREYEARREAVIRGYDGRAAFLAGGIVWRIAFDSVGDPEKAINGPGEYPTMKNHLLFENEGYIDDVLTDHQEAVICGVYRILPSKCQLELIHTVQWQTNKTQVESLMPHHKLRSLLGGLQQQRGNSREWMLAIGPHQMKNGSAII